MKKDNNKTSIDSNGNLIHINAKEKEQTDVEKSGLKGPVHKVMEKHYNSFMKDGIIYISSVIDDYGRDLNTIQVFLKNGSKEYEESKGSNDTYRTYFNEKGLEYKVQVFDNNVLTSIRIKTYNEKSLLYELIDYDVAMVMQYKHIREYDEHNNIINYIEYDKNNTLVSNSHFVYENIKDQIEQKRTDGKGNITLWIKYKNNNKGHCTERTELAPDGSTIKTTSNEHYYDSDGNYVNSRFKNQYDKEIYTNTTEEDKYGNWIKKYVSYNSIIIQLFIKDILYFGEEVPKDFYNEEVVFDLQHNLIAKPVAAVETEEEKPENKIVASEFNAENTQWLADKTTNADLFSISSYYVLKNNEFPSLTYYNACNIDALQLMEELTKGMNAVNIHETKIQFETWSPDLCKYTLIFPDYPGYIIYASQINSKNGEEYHIPEFITGNHNRDDDMVYFSNITLLQPSDKWDNRNKELEAEIKSYIKKCTLEVIPEKPEIYMVEVSNGNFSLQSHPIKDDFEIADLEVSYGHGFSKFHQELMNRFRRENKGLVLFHGLPGTGKTYYIRHLLREMALSNKKVIYMPPNMVDHLVEPSFMTFLTQTVNGYSAQGYFCVLLIEDAEPLLITRATENRIQGITNLLNMTDGILNDMLKLQIICTFNVELKQLDPALLRPGRLIARKEFKALNELDANLLAQRLGINFRFRKPTALSEIYAKLKDKGTIIHEDY